MSNMSKLLSVPNPGTKLTLVPGFGTARNAGISRDSRDGTSRDERYFMYR